MFEKIKEIEKRAEKNVNSRFGEEPQHTSTFGQKVGGGTSVVFSDFNSTNFSCA